MQTLVLLLCVIQVQQTAPAQTFESCRAAFAEQSETYKGADCFYRVGKATQQTAQAAAELRRLLQRNQNQPWVHFYLGRIAQDTGQASALQHYQTALRQFEQRRDTAGQVYCLTNITRISADQGNTQARWDSLQQAERVAKDAGDSGLWIPVALEKNSMLETQGQYEVAEAELAAMEADVFAAGSRSNRIDWLLKKIGLTVFLGQPERGQQLVNRLEKLAEETKDAAAVLAATYSAFMIHEHFESFHSPDRVRDEALALLELAEAYQLAEIAIQVRYFLGKYEGGDVGLDHLDQGLETAVTLKLTEREAQLSIAKANVLAPTQPEQAVALVQHAFAIWQTQATTSAILDSIDDLNQVYAKLDKPRDAFAWSIALLAFIEAMREFQLSDIGRAGFLSRWSPAYYLAAGRLLTQGQDHRDHQAYAFMIMERMRARTMRESLLPQRSPTAAQGSSPQNLELKHFFNDLDPSLDEPKLDGFEHRLRTRADLPAGTFIGLPEGGQWPVASIDSVQAALGANEAMLSFQLGKQNNIYGEPLGGAWITVITRDAVQTFAITKDRDAIASAVSLYQDLLRDPQNSDAANRVGLQLFDLLLQPAMQTLPPAIDHLIVIADVAVHRLPFETLLPSPAATPLGLQYEISMVPSATLWLDWRTNAPLVLPNTDATGALILANSGAGRKPLPASFALSAVASLPTLQNAIAEGKAIEARLGEGSRLYSEAEASETLLKSLATKGYPVIHFAAHAVVDDTRPKLSAIVLSGSESDDGYLFPEEIVQLDLRDKVVVLSTCQSASGYMLYGEGPLSLARAFMKAGARTVIGTLWPIDDAEAAHFFSEFYTALKQGQSISASVKSARIERANMAAAISPWAGITVLGDGAFAPFKKETRKGYPFLLYSLILLVASITLYQFVKRRSGI